MSVKTVNEISSMANTLKGTVHTKMIIPLSFKCFKPVLVCVENTKNVLINYHNSLLNKKYYKIKMI